MSVVTNLHTRVLRCAKSIYYSREVSGIFTNLRSIWKKNPKTFVSPFTRNNIVTTSYLSQLQNNTTFHSTNVCKVVSNSPQWTTNIVIEAAEPTRNNHNSVQYRDQSHGIWCNSYFYFYRVYLLKLNYKNFWTWLFLWEFYHLLKVTQSVPRKTSSTGMTKL